MGLAHSADEVLGQCEIGRACDKASHIPIASTSTVSTANEILQVDLSFLDDAIALRAMDAYSKYSISRPARSENL